MRSIIAVARQRQYFVQAIRRTTSVTSSPTADQSNVQASNFLTTLISSTTKSSDETCSESDGEEEPSKSLSLRIEKLQKGVTVGSALQSWMGDGFPVHGGDVYHAINRLRKLGRNKRALEVRFSYLLLSSLYVSLFKFDMFPSIVVKFNQRTNFSWGPNSFGDRN